MFLDNNYCSDNRLEENFFLPYDVYYNGTMSFSFQRSSNTSHFSNSCAANGTSEQSAWLSIGDMLTPDGKYNRSNWDTNPYWFHLAGCRYSTWFNKNASDYKCLGTESSGTFQSSSSRFYWGQAWTLAATKAGDGYDLRGSITTSKTITINDFEFTLLCGRSSSTNRTNDFSKNYLQLKDGVTLTGHISPITAEMTIAFRNLSVRSTFDSGATLSYTFKGTWWQGGARLLTTDANIPTAEGEARQVVAEPDRPTGGASVSLPWWSYFFIGLGIAAIIGAFFRLYWRRWRHKPNQRRIEPMRRQSDG